MFLAWAREGRNVMLMMFWCHCRESQYGRLASSEEQECSGTYGVKAVITEGAGEFSERFTFLQRKQAPYISSMGEQECSDTYPFFGTGSGGGVGKSFGLCTLLQRKQGWWVSSIGEHWECSSAYANLVNASSKSPCISSSFISCRRWGWMWWALGIPFFKDCAWKHTWRFFFFKVIPTLLTCWWNSRAGLNK